MEVNSYAFQSIREDSISKNNKRITMAQFENGFWKDSFGHNNQSIPVIF